jgi:fatty acid desaturase
MKLHPDELALSHAYARDLPFEGLSAGQMKGLQERAQKLYAWYEAHPYLHNVVGVLVFAFLFGGDYWALMHLPRWFLPDGQAHSTGMILLAAALAGSIHSYLMYSMAIFSVHEAYTHQAMFQPIGPLSRMAQKVASHLCRLAVAEPHFYSEHHISHHGHFGTEEDGEFLNFVRPKRYWRTWKPLATMYSEFACHRPLSYTRSRVLTATLTLAFNGLYSYFLYKSFGGLFTAVAMLIFFPHVGFYLDRTRQFTEHNLMPPENTNGARSFGWGFWGMLLGGGPWGTPCHLEHHLLPHLPWYQQLVMHAHLRSILTPRQREQFLVRPVIGWPRLWWRLIRQHKTVEETVREHGFSFPAP